MSNRSLIEMSPVEIAGFLETCRTAVLATTTTTTGYPHLVAMWYLPVEPDIAVWTYGRSQKVANLRRDGRASLLIESGDTYSELRGVAIDAAVSVIDDPRAVAILGAKLDRRYKGGLPFEEGDEIPPDVLTQASKRVGLILHPVRYRSWDHSKIPQPQSHGL